MSIQLPFLFDYNDEYKKQNETILMVDQKKVNLRVEERKNVDLDDLITFFIEGKRYNPGFDYIGMDTMRDFWIWLGYNPDEVNGFPLMTILEDCRVLKRKLDQQFDADDIEYVTYKLYEYFITYLGRDPKTINLNFDDYREIKSWLGLSPPDPEVNHDATLRRFEEIIVNT